MIDITIRPAREDEYDEVARIWLETFESSGLPHSGAAPSVDDLRARIDREITDGWELFVASTGECIVGMLALVVADKHLDQLFVAPHCQGQGVSRALLSFAREKMPDEIWLRAAIANLRAIRWYEREGFVKEREEVRTHWSGPRAYYRWKRSTEPQ